MHHRELLCHRFCYVLASIIDAPGVRTLVSLSLPPGNNRATGNSKNERGSHLWTQMPSGDREQNYEVVAYLFTVLSVIAAIEQNNGHW